MRQNLFISSFKNKRSLQRGIKALLLLVLLVGVSAMAQNIVCDKFLTDSTKIINGFYEEEKDTIDLLCLGSSNSFCTIDPVVLYEQYGITAYDFGSSSQPMNLTYLYLKEALKTQSPKVVALEVNMMLGDSIGNGGENALRWGYTNLPFSVDKLLSLYENLGKVDAEYVSYLFPVLRYHSRWKELYKTDFVYYFKDKTDYDKGYNSTTQVAQDIPDMSSYASEGESWIAQSNIVYLDRIYALCQEKGISLVLFKSPRQEWYQYDTQAIAQLAGERGLDYVDYNQLYAENPQQLGLDLAADFRDTQHLNDSGAAKITQHFGGWLQARYGLADRRGSSIAASWEDASRYRSRLMPQAFINAATAQECWDMVTQAGDYTIILTDTSTQDARQWVYSDGRVLLEKTWQEDGVEQLDIGGSELVLARMGNVLYQVRIDGTEYYQGDKAWSVVIYDNFTRIVSASLSFEE